MTLPYVLLPYQQAWLADPNPVAIMVKSRRIGITWASCAEAVLTASARGGMDCFYIGPGRDMATEFIRECADWARHLNIAASAVGETLFKAGDDDGTKAVQGFKITFASNKRIVALSSRPSGLRGRQGVIYADEAAFHPDFPGILKSAMAMLIWGGRLRVISTHFGIDNPFNELIEDTLAGKKPYSLHRVTLQEAVEQGLYRRVCEVSGQIWTPDQERKWVEELYSFYSDDAAEELDCVPSSDSSSYLSRWAIDQCMVDGPPILRLSVPKDFLAQSEIERQILIDQWLSDEVHPYLDALPRHLKHMGGQDFARSGDVSALVVVTENENLTYGVPFCVEMRGVPFDNQRQIVFNVLGRLPHFCAAAFDATGNGSYLAEQATVHFPGKAEAVTFSEKWYRENLPRLKDWLEQKRLYIPQHADMLRDLRAFELIRGVPKIDANKRYMGSDNKPRHGDLAVATALAVYAASGATETAAVGLDNTDHSHGYYRERRRRR